MKHKLYSLFEKQDGEWVRISRTALEKAQAIRVFQNQLLMPFLQPDLTKGIRELRPVDDNLDCI